MNDNMNDKTERSDGLDPWELGGWAEGDGQVEGILEGFQPLQCFPSSKTERQMNLFRFTLEAIERQRDGGKDG